MLKVTLGPNRKKWQHDFSVSVMPLEIIKHCCQKSIWKKCFLTQADILLVHSAAVGWHQYHGILPLSTYHLQVRNSTTNRTTDTKVFVYLERMYFPSENVELNIRNSAICSSLPEFWPGTGISGGSSSVMELRHTRSSSSWASSDRITDNKPHVRPHISSINAAVHKDDDDDDHNNNMAYSKHCSRRCQHSQGFFKENLQLHKSPSLVPSLPFPSLPSSPFPSPPLFSGGPGVSPPENFWN